MLFRFFELDVRIIIFKARSSKIHEEFVSFDAFVVAAVVVLEAMVSRVETYVFDVLAGQLAIQKSTKTWMAYEGIKLQRHTHRSTLLISLDLYCIMLPA